MEDEKYGIDSDNTHPRAIELIPEDFFWSTIEETAPFGSDDGADTYAGFADWRQTHKTESPAFFLNKQIDYWSYPVFELYETDKRNATSKNVIRFNTVGLKNVHIWYCSRQTS